MNFVFQFRQTFRLRRDVAYDVIDRYEASEFSPKRGELNIVDTAECDVLSFLWYESTY